MQAWCTYGVVLRVHADIIVACTKDTSKVTTSSLRQVTLYSVRSKSKNICKELFMKQTKTYKENCRCTGSDTFYIPGRYKSHKGGSAGSGSGLG